jgi:hypothetical protein
MKRLDPTGATMGEVRVKVRITNSADAQAAQAGKLPAEKVRSIEADALVDTGAVRSCVPAPLVERLGVVPFESSLVEYADGRKEPVGLADGLRFEVMNPVVFGRLSAQRISLTPVAGLARFSTVLLRLAVPEEPTWESEKMSVRRLFDYFLVSSSPFF